MWRMVMKIKLQLVMMLLAALTVNCFAFSTDTKKFFSSGADPAKSLPADRIYPAGRLFPFSFYSVGGGSVEKRGNLLPKSQKEKDQREIVAAGVTMIGPQYELNDQIIEDARRLKVKAFYTVQPVVDGKLITRKYLWDLQKEKKKLDIKKLEQAVKEIVVKAAPAKEIAWWNISPEELRFWKKSEMLYLKTVSETIRKYDPMKRPVFMYEPNARTAKSLSKTVKYLDIIGKGMYTNHNSMKDSRVWCRWTIEQETQAIKKAGRKGAIPIALPEMFQQPTDKELKLINSWARHDVYSALIAGAKGVIIFSASKRPKFAARQKYLDAYLKICRELNGKLELGQVLLFGKRKDDLTAEIIQGPETIRLKKRRVDKVYKSVDMANISYNNSRYLFLVNSSNKNVELIVGGLVYGSGVTVQDVFSPEEV
eukprot:gnl/Carplike_NY0171/4382_a5945_275.p1 GENE.gnl/Carplike_NY0171/4382_a5945_275~~gnl/Carplike_NY0171/4382_a5945_275.p1  ORF type:complete len:424 (-),score=17.74 gnl/Carplike_NY0171/4382_a5945_275:21-1292(-)